MNMKKIVLGLTMSVLSLPVFAQNAEQTEVISKENLVEENHATDSLKVQATVTEITDADSAVAKTVVVDSIKVDTALVAEGKINIIDHIEVSEFDQKWLETLKKNVIDSSLVIVPEDTVGKLVVEDLPTELLKERIAHLDSQTPFNFEYNPSLEKIIKHYLKNRPQTLANLMGRAKYYFPMFEEHLAKYDIPMEIKYLAIVESALKPNALSRVWCKRFVAIHVWDRKHVWAQSQLLCRRTLRPNQGDRRGLPLSQKFAFDFQRLGPRPGRLQLRPRKC